MDERSPTCFVSSTRAFGWGPGHDASRPIEMNEVPLDRRHDGRVASGYRDGCLDAILTEWRRLAAASR